MRPRKPRQVGCIVTLACGCRHDDIRWWHMCDACRLEAQERHQRAQAEFRGRSEGLIPRQEPKP